MTVPDRQNDREALVELLHTTLDAVVGVFEQAHVDLPDRRYIAWGQSAVDCEQLTVELVQLQLGTPGSDPTQVARCDGPRTAIIGVNLYRCAPGPTPRGGAPSTESLNTSAEQMARDAWILLDAVSEVDARGWGTGVIADVSAIPPNGGFVGTLLNLTVTVP